MKKVMFTAFAVGLCMTANVMAQVPSYVPTNGLVGWWPFNGNANDESGNGYNGTVNGATLTADRFGNTGKAYSFDGVGNNIIVDDNLLLRPSYISLSVWIKTDLTKPNNVVCAKTNFNNAQGEQYGIGVSSNGVANFAIKRNSNCIAGNGWQDCNTAISAAIPNEWINLISTYDGVTMKFYINGMINQMTTPPAGNIDDCSGGNLNIGQFWSGQPEYFKGQIDDIGIWNRALTDQEVLNLYNGNNVGINDKNEIGEILVYPNPSNDHITIDAGNLATMNGYSIKIEDAQGQQVFQNAVNQQQFYVDITTWGGNGLYFVRIIDPQGNTVDIKKIVLQ